MLKEAQARHVGAPQCWHSGNPREGGASGWWCFRGGIGRKGVCVGADVQDCNSWVWSQSGVTCSLNFWREVVALQGLFEGSTTAAVVVRWEVAAEVGPGHI